MPVEAAVHVVSTNPVVSQPGMAAVGTLHRQATPLVSRVRFRTGLAVPKDRSSNCGGYVLNSVSFVVPSAAVRARYPPSLSRSKFVCSADTGVVRFLPEH